MLQIQKDSAIIQARGKRHAAGQVQNLHTGTLMAYAQETGNAYNGLMLSGGTEINAPHRVIVIDNLEVTVLGVAVVTVEDDDGSANICRYHRVELEEDIPVTLFDGEGLISKEYAKIVYSAYCGKHIHISFQIRLQYIKWMLYQVDFNDFLTSGGYEMYLTFSSFLHIILSKKT